VAETPRARHLRTKYNLALREFDFMVVRQEGKCAICGILPKSRLQVDHDHKSGEIRGLLCWLCNKWLSYHWTKERLERAARYMDPTNWTGLFVPAKKKRRKK
jgi:hypothetical protein